MVRLRQTPTFKRAVNRLHAKQKLDLDAAVRTLSADPLRGEAKVGDLAGVRVHKFRMDRYPVLLAYAYQEADNAIKLLALGSHQNFYRDLKR